MFKGNRDHSSLGATLKGNNLLTVSSSFQNVSDNMETASCQQKVFPFAKPRQNLPGVSVHIIDNG